MYSNIDWIFAFIEIAIAMHSLLKGIIDFTWSGLPKYFRTIIHSINGMKSFVNYEAFYTWCNILKHAFPCLYFLFIRLYIQYTRFLEILNSLKIMTSTQEGESIVHRGSITAQ